MVIVLSLLESESRQPSPYILRRGWAQVSLEFQSMVYVRRVQEGAAVVWMDLGFVV